MRSSAHFKSHPVHPMIVPFPFAYLVGSALVDAWARTANRPAWFRTARHLNTLGLGAAVLAAVPGFIDYLFAVPPRSSAKDRATKHMLSNLAALALFAAARSGRRAGAPPPLPNVAAELCGAGLLAAAGWMGGTLVFRNQIGVDHRYANAGKWLDAVVVDTSSSGAIDVGSAGELQVDQMKLLRIGDRRIVLARIEQGHVAFDDRCTHKGGSLADGALACGTVQCPWHGSQFDVTTGAVHQGPADQPIATHDVSVSGGRVWLRL